MADRLSELEARVAELTEELRVVGARVSALERTAPARRRTPGAAAPAGAAASAGADLALATRSVALTGRTLLVLAGAFLLRAMTERGLPASVGIAAGMAYAAAWLLAADRAGGTRAWSAGFHGLAAVLVAFPLLFEATTRFRLLPPALASAALTAFTALALGVAARRRLHALAWLVAAGGVATAVALAAATGRVVPPALYLVLLGVAALWLGYVLDWFDLRWPVAVAADLAVVVVALRSVSAGAVEGPRLAAAVQVALIALYLGSVATRTLVLGRRVVAFEVVQTCGALGAGLGGAALVAARTGGGSAMVGAICVALGAAAYAVAFAFVERRHAGSANFSFYTAIGIVLVLAGSALLLGGSGPALAWALAAVVTAAAARRTRRGTLAAHAAGYAVAAALGSGAIASAVEAAFASSAAADVRLPSPVALAVVLAIGAAAWLGARPAPPAPGLPARLPRLALLGVLAVAAAGVVLGAVAAGLARGAGVVDAGAMATVRTAVLAAAAVAVAAAGRADGWGEAGWLAYPLLGVLGVKILLQDVAQGRPATLVIAFAAYGAALLLVPRLRRRERAAAPAANPGGAGVTPPSRR